MEFNTEVENIGSFNYGGNNSNYNLSAVNNAIGNVSAVNNAIGNVLAVNNANGIDVNNANLNSWLETNTSPQSQNNSIATIPSPTRDIPNIPAPVAAPVVNVPQTALASNTLVKIKQSIELAKADLEKARREYESIDVAANPDLLLVSLAQYAQRKLDRQKELLEAFKALQL